jgi:flagellar hook-associated protein FlgK
MSKYTAWAVLLAGLPATLGCATNLKMTFRSDPPGAALYENGTNFIGNAPYTAEYRLSSSDTEKGTILLKPITARWVSGATATTGSLTANLKQHGYNQQITLFRPKDAPGLQSDIAYGIADGQNRVQQQMADAANRQADAAEAANAAAAVQNLQNLGDRIRMEQQIDKWKKENPSVPWTPYVPSDKIPPYPR